MKENKLWMVGFFGFYSLHYLSSKNPADLWFLAFFGFFAYYFIHKIGAHLTDEMLVKNAQKASSKAFLIPLTTTFLIGFFLAQGLLKVEWTIILLALSFALSLIGYAYLFYHYEKNGDL